MTMPRATMHRVLIAFGRKLDGSWRKSRVVYASFRQMRDAEAFAADLLAKNPTWIVEIRRGRS